MFKNVSYGQLGFTNVPRLRLVFGDTLPWADGVEETTETILSLSRDDYLSAVEAQQAVARRYTYMNRLEQIVSMF